MKIYKVRMIFETVVTAESELQAQEEAAWVARYEDEEPIQSTPSLIESTSDLPKGWNSNCLPWGKGNPDDLTIAEILGKQ